MLRKTLPVLAVLLSGCVSVELPNLVSDTVKAGKDAYHSARGQKTEPAAQESASDDFTLAHSYIGKESQTIAEIKKLCVEEASGKLQQAAGKPVKYTVAQNNVMTLNENVVANCKLVMENE